MKIMNELKEVYQDMKRDPGGWAKVFLGIFAIMSFAAAIGMFIFWVLLSIPLSFYGIYVSYLWYFESVKPTMFGFFCIVILVGKLLSKMSPNSTITVKKEQ